MCNAALSCNIHLEAFHPMQIAFTCREQGASCNAVLSCNFLLKTSMCHAGRIHMPGAGRKLQCRVELQLSPEDFHVPCRSHSHATSRAQCAMPCLVATFS